jgi:hypothetical protein
MSQECQLAIVDGSSARSPREPRLPGSAIAEVAEIAAGTLKRVTLELGGKSANVILPGADLGTAVKVGVAKAGTWYLR